MDDDLDELETIARSVVPDHDLTRRGKSPRAREAQVRLQRRRYGKYLQRQFRSSHRRDRHSAVTLALKVKDF